MRLASEVGVQRLARQQHLRSDQVEEPAAEVAQRRWQPLQAVGRALAHPLYAAGIPRKGLRVAGAEVSTRRRNTRPGRS
jgi:hypothetical protein